MNPLSIGFVPFGDSQIHAAVPILRELRNRGHHTYCAVDEQQLNSKMLKNILEHHNEKETSLSKLKQIDLDLILFDSYPLRDQHFHKYFSCYPYLGVYAKERVKLSHLHMMAGNNLFTTANLCQKYYKNIYKNPLPIVGMPGADIFIKNRPKNRRKTVLYPDSSPINAENRVIFFNWLEKVALKHPEIDFIIKGRFSDENIYNHFPYQSYQSLVKVSTPANLIINNDCRQTHELAAEADIIMGIYCTVLWQAAVNNKPLILLSDYPYDREREDGIVYPPKDDFLSQNNLRVSYKDISAYLENPQIIPPDLLQKEIPYFDASKRIADIIETVYTIFDQDKRLPFIKFDFEYSEDKLEQELLKIKESVRDITFEQLKNEWMVKCLYYNSISEIYRLMVVIDPEFKDYDFNDFLESIDCYNQVIKNASTRPLEEIYSFIRHHKISAFQQCCQRFFKPENMDTIFDPFHVLDRDFIRFGCYAYFALLFGSDEKTATKYLHNLIDKHLYQNGVKTDNQIELMDDFNKIKEQIGIEFTQQILSTNSDHKTIRCMVDALENSIESKDDFWSTQMIILETMEKDGDFTQAKSRTEKLLSRNDIAKREKIYLLFKQASYFEKDNQLENCAAQLRELLSNKDIQPHIHFLSLYKNGSVLERLGAYDSAVEMFQQMLFLVEETGHFIEERYIFGAHYHLGFIYHKLGSNIDCQKHLKECLAMCPDHQAARHLIDSLNF